LLLSGQVLAVFVSQAAAGKHEKGVATNFAVWTRDTKVIIYEISKGYIFDVLVFENLQCKLFSSQQ
jgi:hypothetical protein